MSKFAGIIGYIVIILSSIWGLLWLIGTILNQILIKIDGIKEYMNYLIKKYKKDGKK